MDITALLVLLFILWQAKLLGAFIDSWNARRKQAELLKARAELDAFRQSIDLEKRAKAEPEPEPSQAQPEPRRMSDNEMFNWALIVLGLQPSATYEDVKFAYRRLRALHHPDRGGDADKFLAVQRAYERLTKPI